MADRWKPRLALELSTFQGLALSQAIVQPINLQRLDIELLTPQQIYARLNPACICPLGLDLNILVAAHQRIRR